MKERAPTKKKKTPTIIPRSGHNISRQNISNNALKVMYKLMRANFDAYLVGGSVRDLLLSLTPKDFDVVTDARPKEIRKIFRNSRIIGRRFKLVHVYFEDEVVEVSTFRGNIADTQFNRENSRSPRTDNVYGTIEEDAYRRDITVNALYYNIKDFSIVDYVGGIVDIHSKTICMIGDPKERFYEDPIRMLRVIRLARRLELDIHENIHSQLLSLRERVLEVPSARLLDETIKLFFYGAAYSTYLALKSFDFVSTLFPGCRDHLTEKFHDLLKAGFLSMDDRFASGKTLTPSFLFALFLWLPFVDYYQKMVGKQFTFSAIHQAIQKTFNEQRAAFPISKRFRRMIRQIWVLQFKLENMSKEKSLITLKHRYFRAGFDFLLLRASAADNHLISVVRWWKNCIKEHNEQ